jgi:hypothetical protein
MRYITGDNYWLIKGIMLQVLKVVLKWEKAGFLMLG